MDSDPDAYQRKVEKIRESYEQRKAQATREKGLIVVFTGSGKGKSTAAFGMALRAVQHGLKLGVVQYVKGAMHTAEPDAFDALTNLLNIIGRRDGARSVISIG